MSIAQPDRSENRPSGLNLSSNNPFRNRTTTSPTYPSNQYSPSEPPPRPASRNPFLDISSTNMPPSQTSPNMPFPTSSAPGQALTGNAADLFNELSLDEKSAAPSTQRRLPTRSSTSDSLPPPPYTRTGSENIPPRASNGRRPEDAAMRSRHGGPRSRTNGGASADLDIFADPPAESSRAPRRNSDGSIDVEKRLLDPEEEKKRLEKSKRRERRARHEQAKRDAAKKKLDIIDKLDATSIYGTGLFHHDGPFDACNPHRNRKGSQRAPMSAFAKDSANTTMGGGGPLNKRPDHATFLGNNDEEAFKDYSKGGAGALGYEPYSGTAVGPDGRPKLVANVESPTTRVEPIHGEETLGLGTSTFLEGAPASRAALQRKASERAASPTEGGGLSRTKSLAQKIRSINNRREYGPSGRITNPDVNATSPDEYTPGGSKINETNPFFNEFSNDDDGAAKKDASITIVEPDRMRQAGPSSPRRGYGERLERRATSDGGDSSKPPLTSSNNGGGGGFLSRVKSLRKPKMEKPLPTQPQAL